jgi:hypothetical protein
MNYLNERATVNFFNVWLTVHLELYSCNEPTWCTIFTVFRYNASTCFGLIFSPSSGGQVCNVAMVILLLLKRLSAGLDKRREDIRFKSERNTIATL